MGRREDNRRRRTERLLSEGLALFREVGFERSSIEQIAARCDVARGTFYLYFPDKRALFATLIDQWASPTERALSDATAGLRSASGTNEAWLAYARMAEALARVGLEHRDALLVSFGELRSAGEGGELVRARERRILDQAFAMTRIAAERGWITAEDPRLVALIVGGAVERLIWGWLAGDDIGDPMDTAQRVLRFIGRALALPDRG